MANEFWSGLSNGDQFVLDYSESKALIGPFDSREAAWDWYHKHAPIKPGSTVSGQVMPILNPRED